MNTNVLPSALVFLCRDCLKLLGIRETLTIAYHLPIACDRCDKKVLLDGNGGKVWREHLPEGWKPANANFVLQALAALPERNCKHCRQTGSEGIVKKTGLPIVCRCVKKKLAKLGFATLEAYMFSFDPEAVQRAKETVEQAGQVGTIT